MGQDGHVRILSFCCIFLHLGWMDGLYWKMSGCFGLAARCLMRIARASARVWFALTLPVQASITFGGRFFRAAANVLDFDPAAWLFAGFGVSLACAGGCGSNDDKRHGCSDGDAEAGKCAAGFERLRQGHGASLKRGVLFILAKYQARLQAEFSVFWSICCTVL